MTKNTIIRTVVWVVALVNHFLLSKGITPLPFEEGELAEFTSECIFIFSSLWVWWKNNSVTPEAVKADRYLNDLKLKKKVE